MHNYDGMWFGMGWGWIVGLVVLILAIVLIVRVSNQKKGTLQDSGKSPMDILKERYANGDISKEEFEEKKKDIS